MSWRKLRLALRDAHIVRLQSQAVNLAPWIDADGHAGLDGAIESLRSGKDPEELTRERRKEAQRRAAQGLSTR